MNFSWMWLLQVRLEDLLRIAQSKCPADPGDAVTLQKILPFRRLTQHWLQTFSSEMDWYNVMVRVVWKVRFVSLARKDWKSWCRSGKLDLSRFGVRDWLEVESCAHFPFTACDNRRLLHKSMSSVTTLLDVWKEDHKTFDPSCMQQYRRSSIITWRDFPDGTFWSQ